MYVAFTKVRGQTNAKTRHLLDDTQVLTFLLCNTWTPTSHWIRRAAVACISQLGLTRFVKSV